MKGYVPQQVELWYIIPAIRKELTKIMVSKGLSQKEAAQRLGITESAVSQYMKKKRATEAVDFDASSIKEMGKSAERIMKGGSVVRETQKMCELLRKKRITCKVSKRLGYAARGCNECFE